jgi:sialic acid synthase SpsE
MRTKIIAEIGYNHNGSFEYAKKLIREVAKLGLWAVKFQKWDIEGFPEHIRDQVRSDETHNYGETYYEHRKFLEFSIEQLAELKEYAEKKGLEFIVSGKDLQSLKDLMELNLRFIKIPSQRYLDNEVFKFLYYERKKRRFYIMASTGMLRGKQIMKSRWTHKDGADVLMHCISQYPADLNLVNLAWMDRIAYNGYSSHEIDGKAIVYAICKGAQFIERHFTLDKSGKGSDHSISSDVAEMKRIIKDIEELEIMLGCGGRNISQNELELGKYYRSF